MGPSRKCITVMLVVLGAASAWAPHFPASKQSAKQSVDFRPMQWAVTGIMAASLAFTPLPSSADQADVRVRVDSSSQVEIKVKMDTTEFLRSIQENKGDINSAISNIVKNAPSDAIKLDTSSISSSATAPKYDVPTQGAIAAPVAKTETPKPVEAMPPEVKSPEVKSEAPAAPVPVVEKQSTDDKKVEAPKSEDAAKPIEAPAAPTSVVKENEPKPVADEKKIESPRPDDLKKLREAPVATATAAAPVVKKDDTKPLEEKKASEVPAAKVETPKPVEANKEAPVTNVPVVKDDTKPAEVKQEPPTSAAPTPTTPAVKKEQPKPVATNKAQAPKVVKTSEPRKDGPQPVTAIAIWIRDSLINLGYAIVSNFRETKEQAAKKNFDDVSFWERPAFRPSIPVRDGKGKLRLFFSTGQVVGGTVFGAGAAYLTKFKYDNRKRSERMGKSRYLYDPRQERRQRNARVGYNNEEPVRYDVGRDDNFPRNSNSEQNYAIGRQQIRPDNTRKYDAFVDTQAGGDNPWKVPSSPSDSSNNFQRDSYSGAERRITPPANNVRSTTNSVIPQNDRRPSIDRGSYIDNKPWKVPKALSDRPVVERYSGVGRREAVRPANNKRPPSNRRPDVDRVAYKRADVGRDQNPWKTPHQPYSPAEYNQFNEPRRPPDSSRTGYSNRSAGNNREHASNWSPGLNGDDDFDDGENPWLVRRQGPR